MESLPLEFFEQETFIQEFSLIIHEQDKLLLSFSEDDDREIQILDNSEEDIHPTFVSNHDDSEPDQDILFDLQMQQGTMKLDDLYPKAIEIEN